MALTCKSGQLNLSAAIQWAVEQACPIVKRKGYCQRFGLVPSSKKDCKVFDSKNIDKRSVALSGDISKRTSAASFHLKYIFMKIYKDEKENPSA